MLCVPASCALSSESSEGACIHGHDGHDGSGLRPHESPKAQALSPGLRLGIGSAGEVGYVPTSSDLSHSRSALGVLGLQARAIFLLHSPKETLNLRSFGCKGKFMGTPSRQHGNVAGVE